MGNKAARASQPDPNALVIPENQEVECRPVHQRGMRVYGPNTYASQQLLPVPECPVWVDDEEFSKCMNCDLPFTVVRRRHHCRSCGKLLCNSCCSHRISLPKLGYSKRQEQRVCDSCLSVHQQSKVSMNSKFSKLVHARRAKRYDQVDWKLMQKLSQNSSRKSSLTSTESIDELFELIYSTLLLRLDSMDLEKCSCTDCERNMILYGALRRLSEIGQQNSKEFLSAENWVSLTQRMQSVSHARSERTLSESLPMNRHYTV